METPDEKLIRLIDLLKFHKRISSTKEFCQEIGILEQTISKIKNKKNSFTVLHIVAICKKYDVNANWIISNEKKVFNTKNSIEV